ncbi:MAG: radical SAM protein, partial [Deltaproteobacteria bacterium]|nr:radical SAM protein [Deltaproteobacteria bacterium]
TLDEFADLIIESGLNVRFGGMAVASENMTLPLLKKLKKAGCNELSFGVETGSQDVLNMMNKHLHTPQSASRVLKDSKEAGIENTVFIIVGFPGEKERHFYETLHFVRENFENIDRLMVNRQLILEGSRIFKKPANYGIAEGVDSNNSFFTVDGLNDSKIRQERWNTLYLLFVEKMTLIETPSITGENPVLRLALENKNLKLKVEQIKGLQEEIKVRNSASKNRDGSAPILSLWKNGINKMWKFNNQINQVGVNEYVATNRDPFMIAPQIDAAPGQPKFIKLSLKHEFEQPVSSQVFWRVPGQNSFTEQRSVRFSVPASDNHEGFETVYIDIRKYMDEALKGEPIIQLRLDPLEQSGKFMINDIVLF